MHIIYCVYECRNFALVSCIIIIDDYKQLFIVLEIMHPYQYCCQPCHPIWDHNLKIVHVILLSLECCSENGWPIMVSGYSLLLFLSRLLFISLNARFWELSLCMVHEQFPICFRKKDNVQGFVCKYFFSFKILLIHGLLWKGYQVWSRLT